MGRLSDSFILGIPGEDDECESVLEVNSGDKSQNKTWASPYTVGFKFQVGRTGTGALRVNIGSNFAIAWTNPPGGYGTPSGTVSPATPSAGSAEPCTPTAGTITGQMPDRPQTPPTQRVQWTGVISMTAQT